MKLSTILEDVEYRSEGVAPEGVTPEQAKAWPTMDIRLKNKILHDLVIKMAKQFTADNYKMAADTEAMLARHRNPEDRPATRPEARVTSQ